MIARSDLATHVFEERHEECTVNHRPGELLPPLSKFPFLPQVTPLSPLWFRICDSLYRWGCSGSESSHSVFRAVIFTGLLPHDWPSKRRRYQTLRFMSHCLRKLERRALVMRQTHGPGDRSGGQVTLGGMFSSTITWTPRSGRYEHCLISGTRASRIFWQLGGALG